MNDDRTSGLNSFLAHDSMLTSLRLKKKMKHNNVTIHNEETWFNHHFKNLNYFVGLFSVQIVNLVLQLMEL